MSCRKVNLDKRKVCIGDLRYQIVIHNRAIAGVQNGVDFTESLTNAQTVWAGVKTVRGHDVFDGTNLVGVATHLFYIRYIDITAESWVEFNGRYYRILGIQNLEEDDEFIELQCNLRGDKNKATNLK